MQCINGISDTLNNAMPKHRFRFFRYSNNRLMPTPLRLPAIVEKRVVVVNCNHKEKLKESFKEREGSDIHRNDTVQETLSLSERFGLRVMFAKPEKRLYLDIVHELARRKGVDMPESELDIKAEAFVLRHGYRSARCAEQFIDSLM